MYYGSYGGYYYGFDWTYLLIIAAFLISLIVQTTMQSTFRKYSRIGSMAGMTGADVARRIITTPEIRPWDFPNLSTDRDPLRRSAWRLMSAGTRFRMRRTMCL